MALHERTRETARLRSGRPARAMRRGFAENSWRVAITPSSNASSKTVSDLAGHAGRHFKTTECNALCEISEGPRHALILSPRRAISVADGSLRLVPMNLAITKLTKLDAVYFRADDAPRLPLWPCLRERPCSPRPVASPRLTPAVDGGR